MDLTRWEQWLDRYTGTRRETAALHLLIDGEQFFPRLQKAIAQATNHIRFESFIFDRDDTAVSMAEQLKQCSTHVETTVLMDRLGSVTAAFSTHVSPLPEHFVPPASITSFLKNRSGVSVRHFLDPWFRVDHAKVYMVDGRQAWLGGMNIDRDYKLEWHDVMIEIDGPLVRSLERSFQRHWAHAGPLGDFGYVMSLLRQGPCCETDSFQPGCIQVRRLPTRTFWKPFSAAVQGAIQRSQSYVYVENPYLFDRSIIRDLIRARSRGVDVRVILPRTNDSKAGGRSNLVVADLLLSHGVRMFFYPGMTHVKSILVDG
jgi:phosphatidylserine/phosphatidylglycerophosphate/cardiolipin synthase-like enzyme